MRKSTEEAWKRCPKCGKIENQIKAGYNGSGSQRCKCKECGIYYTINPKRHEYPEETRKLAIKMYYGGVSGRGVGKILQMNKSNVMNWIKKERQKGAEGGEEDGAPDPGREPRGDPEAAGPGTAGRPV